VPWERATVHLLSHSLQRGSLIFDYMSLHPTPRGAAVFRLPEHVERFLRSAELVHLPVARDAAALEAAVLETARANPGATAIKLCAFVASIEVDVVPQDDRVSIAVAAYDPIEDVIKRNRGSFHWRPEIRLWVERDRRNRRRDIVPAQAKVAANYVSPMGAKWDARRRGYDEVLLVDEHGCVAEGPTTNVFWVDRDGFLRTPPEEHVLHGVTRRSILEIAKHDGIRASEVLAQPEALFAAAEVFLTGTTSGVWPVVQVDEHVIGDGKPGPVTLRLKQRFEEITGGRDAAFAHWLTPVGQG
jgi:branched-chain amino acid aminotransferase